MTQKSQSHRLAAFWVVLLAALGAAAYCLLTPPPGEISDSALILVAQFLVAAGTFIGVDIWVLKSKNTFINEIKDLINDKENENKADS